MKSVPWAYVAGLACACLFAVAWGEANSKAPVWQLAVAGFLGSIVGRALVLGYRWEQRDDH